MNYKYKKNSNEMKNFFSHFICLFLMILLLLIGHGLVENTNIIVRLACSLCEILLCIGCNSFLDKAGFVLANIFCSIHVLVLLYTSAVLGDSLGLPLCFVSITALIVNFIFNAMSDKNNSKLFELLSFYSVACETNNKLHARNYELDAALTRTAMYIRRNNLGKTNNSTSCNSINTVPSNTNITNNAADIRMEIKQVDSMTTLPDKNFILNYLDRIIDESKSTTIFQDRAISVIYLRTNNLKSIIKIAGHQIVDVLIQGIAHKLRDTANEEDLTGRIVGSEFVVITKRTLSEKELLSYAEKLKTAIEDFFKSDSSTNFISISVGISSFPNNAYYSGELLKKAESSMREAMISNDSQICFCHSFRDLSIFKQNTVEEINKIFDKNIANKSIYMVYQPQFDKNENLVGFEAFLRWNNSDYGYIKPLDFLYIASKTGYIKNLISFCFQNAAKTLKLINSLRPELKLILNLSGEQVKNAAIIPALSIFTEDSNININNLEFDIPEEVLVYSFDKIENHLLFFYNKGISLSLDNFGRGYSSLNSIPLLPVKSVKLNSNFVQLGDSIRNSVASTSIALLNEIDVSVVSTNVETKSQFEQLINYGCDFFQGNYFSKPLLFNEIKDYINSL